MNLRSTSIRFGILTIVIISSVSLVHGGLFFDNEPQKSPSRQTLVNFYMKENLWGKLHT
jgi:hypothetical protein